MIDHVDPKINTADYPHAKFFIPNLVARNKGEYEKIAENFLARHSGENTLTPPARIFTNGSGDEIYCTPELFDLVVTLKAHMHDIDFLLPPGRATTNITGLVCALSVFRTGDLFAMGEVAYCATESLTSDWGSYNRTRFAYHEDGNLAYMVGSPYIENGRYKVDSRGYSFKTSADVGKIAKIAKKFLRSYSPIDCGYALTEEYKKIPTAELMTTRKKFTDLELQMRQGSGLRHRIVCTLSDIVSGVTNTVSDSEVAQYVSDYKQVIDEFNACRGREVNATFVMLARNGSIVTIPFKAENCSSPMRATQNPTVYESTDAAPETILSAAATLDMLEAKEYLPEVGIRVSDRAYWLEL